MANGVCDMSLDSPHGRNHILTTLSPPVTIELCDDHYAAGLIPLLAADLGLDPSEFYAYIEKYVKREAAKAAREQEALETAEASQASQVVSVPPAETTGTEYDESSDDHEETGLFHGSGGEAL